jgi:uncharacterized protein (PEP-CTERM system associated)
MAATKHNSQGWPVGNRFDVPCAASRAVPSCHGIRLCALALALSAPGVYAADWKITPNVSVSERYSDNVNLAPAGQELGGFTTEINPGVSIATSGAGRIKTHVDYTLRSPITFGQVQTTSRANHQLNGTANATLVDETLYMDATARVGQQNLSLVGPVGTETADSSNIATYRALSLSPYLRHRFGSFASGDARYTRDYTNYSNGGTSSTGDAFNLALNSGTSFSQLFWGLNYSKQKVAYANDAVDREFERESATLGYNLTPKFRLFATAGDEQNTYAAAAGVSTGGSYWNAGAGFAPTTRTSLEASYGQRFFGKTYTLNLSHRTRRTTWAANYLQDIVDARTYILTPQTRPFIFTDSTGRQLVLVDSVTGKPVLFTFEVPTLTNDVYISKSFTGSLGIATGKSTVTLSVFDTIRESQLTALNDSKQYGTNAAWGFKLTGRTTSTLSAGWSRLTTPGVDREDDLWNIRYSLTRQFNPKASGSLELRHQQRSSNQAVGDYRENAISGIANMTF